MSDVQIENIISTAFHNVHCDIAEELYTHYMLSGGRGSTKSSFASIEIVLLLLKNPQTHALAMRKVGNTMRDSVYTQILWAIEILGLSHKFKTTVSPMEITYIDTGQKIYFRGADKPIKLKSIKPKFGYIGIAWYEELDQFNGMEEIRNINQSIMRGGEQFNIFYTFNPPKTRDSWVNVEKLETKAGRLNHHSTYETVPVEWLGNKFIEEAEELKLKKPQAYEHEYLGIATGTGGQVFENVIESTIEINALKTFYSGLDFGFAVDPLAWVKVSYDAKYRRLYVLDEIYEPKLKNLTAVNRIKAKDTSGTIIYADSAEPKSIAEMSELGLPIHAAQKGRDSVEHGIKWLQDLDEIIIDKRRTPEAYKEFILYEYEQTKDGKYISAYPDKNNHAIDAVRYALNKIIQNNAIKVVENVRGF